MKAKIVKATSTSRVKLGEAAPLKTPFTLEIFPTNVCNFRCTYCAHSNRPKQYRPEWMSFEIYKKCIDDLNGFDNKLKLLLIAGLGEPLLHPDIDKMVRYAKDKNIAETVRIISNGSVLSPELSDKLIAAGLDSLKISIQGLHDKKYKEMCNSPVPFDQIVQNVRYFYENKKDTIVNVKIVSDAFEKESDEQEFYQIFGDICDEMNIEHVVGYQEGTNILKSGYISQTGTNTIKNEICQIPFYFLSVYPNGEIIPCCLLTFLKWKALSMGNVKNTDISRLWNEKVFHEFRLMHLEGQKAKHVVCKDCEEAYTSQCREEDNIDMFREELIFKYNKMLGGGRTVIPVIDLQSERFRKWRQAS